MKVERSGKVGDIKKLEVTANGQDISTCVECVEIFQDIFAPCWTAKISVNDSLNLMMTVPIKPGIEVKVKVETKTESEAVDGSKDYTFYLYNLGDKRFIGQMQQTYSMFCATKGFLKNMSQRVQKCYSNMKPESIVSNIVSEYIGGSVESHTSDNNYHIIVPNWSPFLACWWTAKIAIKNNASDFIFYMNDTEKYSFKSLEEIYKNESTGVKFTQKPSDMRNDSGDFDTDYSVMINKYHYEHYDGFGNLGAGFYKNKLLSYDMIKKKWESKVFTFGDDIKEDKEKKPWDSEFFDNAENANISFLPKHPGMHTNQTIDDQITNWHVSRKTRIMKLAQDCFTMQIPGGAKCWEWLAKTCDIDLPSQQDASEGDVYDKYLKGKYLITHVYHNISHGYYTTNIEANAYRYTEKMK